MFSPLPFNTPKMRFPHTMRLLDIKACLRTGHFLVRPRCSYPSLGNRISFRLSDKPGQPPPRRSATSPRPLTHISFEVPALTCKFRTVWLVKGLLMRLGNEYSKRSKWLPIDPSMCGFVEYRVCRHLIRQSLFSALCTWGSMLCEWGRCPDLSRVVPFKWKWWH